MSIRVTSPEFIGRTRELAELTELAVRAADAPPAPRKLRTPVLSFLGKPLVGTGSVAWTLACTGATCRVAAQLTTRERVVARVHGKRRTRTITVTIGSASASIASGRRDRLVVALNATGRRLHAKAGRLGASLAFSLVPVAGNPHRVRTVRITFAAR